MRTNIALALAVTAVMAPAWQGTAHAAPSPTGATCGLVAVTDPQLSGAVTGLLFGGPLVMSDDTDLARLYSGSVQCTVQVNAGTHSGANARSVTGPTGPVSAAVDAVTFDADVDDNVYVCTSVRVGTLRLYWDSRAHLPGNPLQPGHWSTDSGTACALANRAETPGENQFPHDELEELAFTINLLICPTLATLLPPAGDVPGVWDCPPYDSSDHLPLVPDDQMMVAAVVPEVAGATNL